MKENKFTETDLDQIEKHGLKRPVVEKQLQTFREGIPFVKLVGAAGIDNGILRLDEKQTDFYQQIFDNTKTKKLKFVPASGAASRMFKLLFAFVKEYDYTKENLQDFLKQEQFLPLQAFTKNIKTYAFYPEVEQVVKEEHPNFENLSQDQQFYLLVNTLLYHKKLKYAALPKGLVPFHRYENIAVSAFEEHLYEAANYARQDKTAFLHFTVAKEHLPVFEKTFTQIKDRVENETQTTFEIDYSFQEKSTDTIAVNFDNSPFRQTDKSLLFRPGGHGALIENLNNVDADLIFIKNIDNVPVRKHLNEVCYYKKVLGGILLEVQNEIFDILETLDQQRFNNSLLKRANKLIQEKLSLPVKLTTEKEIKNYLNRPIRVCGMVKNQGAPGGGPFWVKDGKGEISLQIVEGAQIDPNNASQQKIVKDATHFNPVDIVCGVKDYKGQKFDLHQFINPNKGFITKKSKNGQQLKALELPGLWNGAMAYWNTIFVETPLLSFNPVKTVLDLGKPSHQTN